MSNQNILFRLFSILMNHVLVEVSAICQTVLCFPAKISSHFLMKKLIAPLYTLKYASYVHSFHLKINVSGGSNFFFNLDAIMFFGPQSSDPMTLIQRTILYMFVDKSNNLDQVKNFGNTFKLV